MYSVDAEEIVKPTTTLVSFELLKLQSSASAAYTVKKLSTLSLLDFFVFFCFICHFYPPFTRKRIVSLYFGREVRTRLGVAFFEVYGPPVFHIKARASR